MVQSFTDEPLTQCPACEGRLRKLFSSVGVVFKGSGFYRTDSRNGANKDGAKSDAEKTPAASSSESSGSSGSSGSSESSSSSASEPKKTTTPPAAKPAAKPAA